MTAPVTLTLSAEDAELAAKVIRAFASEVRGAEFIETLRRIAAQIERARAGEGQ